MITEHAFCALPEDHPLRRHYTVVARREIMGWVVEHLGTGYLLPDGDPAADDSYSEPGAPPAFMGESTAVARAEAAASLVRAWTVKGVLTAAEADAAGLR